MNDVASSPVRALLRHTLDASDQCLNRGDFSGAYQALSRALHLSPNDPEILGQRGRVALILKDSEGAQRDFAEALKLDPGCSAALSGQAGCSQVTPSPRASTGRSVKFGRSVHKRHVWHKMPYGDFVPPIYSFLDEEEWSIMESWFEETEKLGYTGESTVPFMSFLQALIMGNRLRSIVQLGTFAGFSSLLIGFMLRRIGAGARLLSADVDKTTTDFTLKHVLRARLDEHVKIVLSDSKRPELVAKAVDYFEGERPRLVIIDSSHERDQTLVELDLWYDALQPGGFLILHDTSALAQEWDKTGRGGVKSAFEDWGARNPDIPRINIDCAASVEPGSPYFVYQDWNGIGMVYKRKDRLESNTCDAGPAHPGINRSGPKNGSPDSAAGTATGGPVVNGRREPAKRSPEAGLEAARLDFEQNRVENALRAAKQVLAGEAQNVDALLLAARCYDRLGDFPRARDACLRVQQLSPGSREASRLLDCLPAHGLALDHLEACPVCAGTSFNGVFELNDGSLPLRLQQCDGCEIVFMSPRLTETSIKEVEEDNSFYTYPPDELREEIRKRVELIRSFERYKRPPGRMIDIGCNRGLLLEAARVAGWEPFGIDISNAAVERIRRDFGLEAWCGSLDAFAPPHAFDLCVAWHVLEHTVAPGPFLSHLHRLLAANGVLALQVPNYGRLKEFSAQNRIFSLVNKVHNFHFTRATLGRLVTAAGFEILQLIEGHDHMVTVFAKKPA